MFWLVFCATVTAATTAFMWRLAAGDDRWRFAALYSACICLVIAGVFAVIAFMALRWTCDEGCFGPGWRNSTDGWQWQARADLAAAGLVGIALAMLLVAFRRYRTGFAVFLLGIVPFVPFAAIELS